MSAAIKSGSLDFGDLKSGGASNSNGFPIESPGFKSENEKTKVSSPRSPVGRTDKRTKAQDSFSNAADVKKTPPNKDTTKMPPGVAK